MHSFRTSGDIKAIDMLVRELSRQGLHDQIPATIEACYSKQSQDVHKRTLVHYLIGTDQYNMRYRMYNPSSQSTIRYEIVDQKDIVWYADWAALGSMSVESPFSLPQIPYDPMRIVEFCSQSLALGYDLMASSMSEHDRGRIADVIKALEDRDAPMLESLSSAIDEDIERVNLAICQLGIGQLGIRQSRGNDVRIIQLEVDFFILLALCDICCAALTMIAYDYTTRRSLSDVRFAMLEARSLWMLLHKHGYDTSVMLSEPHHQKKRWHESLLAWVGYPKPRQKYYRGSSRKAIEHLPTALENMGWTVDHEQQSRALQESLSRLLLDIFSLPERMSGAVGA